MKKIRIEVKQRGTDEFIIDSSVRVFVDNKEVENKTKEIIKRALEIPCPFELKEISYDEYYFNRIKVCIGVGKKTETFKKDIWNRCFSTGTKEEIREYINNIKTFIKSIEEWAEKTANNYSEFSLEVC